MKIVEEMGFHTTWFILNGKSEIVKVESDVLFPHHMVHFKRGWKDTKSIMPL